MLLPLQSSPAAHDEFRFSGLYNHHPIPEIPVAHHFQLFFLLRRTKVKRFMTRFIKSISRWEAFLTHAATLFKVFNYSRQDWFNVSRRGSVVLITAHQWMGHRSRIAIRYFDKGFVIQDRNWEVFLTGLSSKQQQLDASKVNNKSHALNAYCLRFLRVLRGHNSKFMENLLRNGVCSSVVYYNVEG